MFNPEYITYVWLILGAAFIAFEALGVPGLGFLFSGMAAVSLGLIINFGWIENDSYAIQAGAFFGLTGVFAVLLWKPIYKNKPKDGEINDVVGKIGTVLEGGIKKGEKGNISWSGSQFVARIADNSDCTEIPEGKEVKIISIQGNILMVEPADTSK